MPKRGVKRGMRGNRTETTYEHRQRKREMTERENSLESSIYQLIIHLGLSENEIDNMPDNHLVGFFRKRIQDVYDAKLDSLRKKGVVTRSDVTRSLNAIKELTIGTCHKIVSMGQRDIRVRFDPTGHLVTGPACSIGIELPIPGSKRNILFSGDQGNPKLGYPGTNPDYTDLYNKYDTIIMESTYGGSLHPDRANELRKLDAKVSRAIRSKKDIIVVSLALERPVYILYEILQCLKNNGIKPNEVDISYFGESIATLFHYFPKGEIRDMVKPFLKPLIPAATPTPQKNAIMSKLGKRGEKPRIIIASCGFFHPEGPSSRLLEKMYPQSELLIISPNFHGERGSNGYNLFRGHPYQMGLETFEPKPGHDLFSARCFSGHGDREHLVRYARKTARDGKNAGKGGKVFLNHGSERSRLDLAAALESDPVIQSKKVEVVLPKIGRTYKANR